MPDYECITEVPPYPTQPYPLKAEGKRRWDWYCKMLIRRKLLAEPFLITIEEACRLHDELADLRKEFEAIKSRTKGKGQVTYTKTSRKPNPLLAAIQSHSKLLERLQDRLGCTPAAARNHNIPVMLPEQEEVQKPGKSKTTRPQNLDVDFE